jgi:hypothetical protein
VRRVEGEETRSLHLSGREEKCKVQSTKFKVTTTRTL